MGSAVEHWFKSSELLGIVQKSNYCEKLSTWNQPWSSSSKLVEAAKVHLGAISLLISMLGIKMTK